MPFPTDAFFKLPLVFNGSMCQVSSSVGERESLRCGLTKPGDDDNVGDNDNNWDINDPDIPARIDQYVGII